MDPMIVRVCTFNLRRGDLDHGTPNDWIKRRSIVKNCLKQMQPQIIGTQEGYPPQLQEILDDLNDSSKHVWSWVGEELNEWKTTNAIFYRHDQFKLVSSKIFWFNENPSQAVAAWGAKNPRGCTRAQFEQLSTGKLFTIYNAHLDYPSAEARKHSIPVLLAQIAENGDSIDRVIVTGDFNNWPEEIEGTTPLEELIVMGENAPEIEQMKQAGFVDTYSHGQTPTFNGFRKAGYGPKIDFIWISSNSVYRVQGESKIDQYHDDHGFFPSDHFPVYCDLLHQ